jgi:hypothetical protein
MKRILPALLGAIAVCMASAQTVPRLDGHWRLDPARSTGGNIAPASRPEITLAVAQTDAEVVVELGAQAKRVCHYKIGRNSSEVLGGQRTTASARWESDRLIVTGEGERPDGQMIPYRLVMSLVDANTLLMEERQSAPNTEFTSRRVFTRTE